MATVDSRVVEMKFENKLFEKNVDNSIHVLERLKSALDFSNSTKSFEEIEQSVGKLDFSSIEKSLSSLNDRFSVFGVAGMTVISNLTSAAMELGATIANKVLTPITTGGWNRATNIDKAKFQLEGLKVAWDEISDDINYGVSDTAYGLDAAATAASQLVASGVKFGETFGETGNSPMAKALRGISGVAAMTNSSYEEISSIFTTVAGQGKLMTMQLRQLEARGLNAAAKLGEAMGHTEEEIREMVTKGEIDFATFSEKMDEAFGEHAKEANRTFEGALANMKSALSRIGADFVTPYRAGMIPIFNQLRLIFNDIKKNRLTQVYRDFDDFAAKASNFVTYILEHVNVGFINDITRALHNIYTEFDEFMGKLFPFWKKAEEKTEELKESAVNTVEAIEEVANKVLGGEFGNGDERKKALEDLGYVYEQVQNKVNELLGVEYRYDVEAAAVTETIKEKESALDRLNDKLEESDKGMHNFTENEKKWLHIHSNVTDTFTGLSSLVSIITKIAGAASSGGFDKLKDIGTTIATIFTDITAAIGRSITALDKFLEESGFYESVSTFVNNALTSVSSVLDKISAFISNITKGEAPLSGIFESIGKVFDSEGAANFNDFLAQLLSNLNDLLIQLSGDAVEDAFTLVGKFFEGMARLTPKVIRALPMLYAVGKIGSFFTGIGRTMVAVSKTIYAVPQILKAYAHDIDATALLKVGGAVLILSGALALLSMVSWDGLARGIIGVGFAIGSLLGVLWALNAMMGSSGLPLGLEWIQEKLEQVFQVFANEKNSTSILKLAVAIGILAAAMLALGQMPIDSLIKGAAAIVLLTGAIMGLLFALSKMPTMIIKSPMQAFSQAITKLGTAASNFLNNVSTAALLAALGATILMLAGALIMLSKIDWKDGLKAIGFMGLMLTELLLFLRLLKPSSGDLGDWSDAGVIMQMGSTIKSFAETVKILSKVPWAEGIKGVVLLGLLLLEFVGVMKYMTKIDDDLDNIKMIAFMYAISYVSKSLSNVVTKLSKIPFLDGLKAIGFLGLLLAELYYATNAMGKISSDKSSLMTLAFMVVIGYVADGLADTIGKLAKIPFLDGLKAVGLLGVLLGELVWSLNSISGQLKGTQGIAGLIAMIGLAAAVTIMTAAIEKLSAISAFGIVKAEAAIAGISLIMTKLMDELSKIEFKSVLKSVVAIVPIVIALLAVITAITALTDTEPSKLLAAGAAITMVMASMVAFAGGMKILTKVKFTKMLGSLLGFIVVLGAIAGILYLMRDLEADKIKSMADALSEMMAAMGILAAGAGLLGAMGPISALSGVLGTGALLIVLTAIVGALGYIDSKTGLLTKALDKGIPLLQKVGEAIGSLFGGFLTKALFEPLSKSFDGIGEGINSFIENIRPLVDGTTKVSGDTSNIENIKKLLEAIGEVMSESFWTGLKSAFADNTGQKLSFDNISKFLDNFVPFAERVKDLKTKKASAKLTAIKDILTSLTKINVQSFKTWISQQLASLTDISGSFERIKSFVGPVVDLAKQLEPLSKDPEKVTKKVETVRQVIKDLASVNLSTWLSGITESWAGEDSVMSSINYLILFAEKVVYFAQVMNNAPKKGLDKAHQAFDAIKEFCDLIPGTSGLWQYFNGDKKLDSFGADLEKFGNHMVTFFSTANGIDVSGSDKVSWALLRLTHVFEKVYTEGGISDPAWLGERLNTVVHNLDAIFKVIADDISDEQAKTPLLDAGEKMFNYLLEGFETAGKGYSDAGKVSGSIDKVAEAIIKALKGDESQEALDKEAVKFIEGIVTAMSTAITESEEPVTTTLTDMLKNAIEAGITESNIRFTNMDTAVRKKLSFIVQTIAGYKGSITSAIETAFSGAEGALSREVTNFKKLGGDIMDGLIKGINDKASAVATATSTAASGSLDSAKTAVDSHSPSREFMKLGANMMEGLRIGVEHNDGLPINAVAKVASSMVGQTGDKISEFGSVSNDAMGEVIATILGAWAYITTMVDQDMTWQPVISPVLDLTNVQSGLSGMNSILSSGYHFGAAGVPDIYADRVNVAKSGDLYNQEAIVSQIRSLRSEIATLGEAISNMQVIMSTGQVVGAVTPGIDRELGSIQKYNARWA